MNNLPTPNNEGAALADIAKPPIEELTPEVSSDVFLFQPQAQFWIGVPALGNNIHMPNEAVAYGQLRANVYIDENHFLDESVRRPDGTESDADDARSIHYAVLQDTKEAFRLPKVIGAARLIQKRDETDILPVEKLFPDVFASRPAPVNSVEASRFISRHRDRDLQSKVSLSLIRSMVMEAYAEGSPYIYAVVEQHLVHLFQKIGLPLDQLAEARPIEEYNNTLNMPLRFDPRKIVETAQADTEGALKMSPFFRFCGPNQGLGFFDQTLMKAPRDVDETHRSSVQS